MVNSRRIEDLTPATQALARALLAKAAERGLDLAITSTYRDLASQQALFDRGRTAASLARGERIVTNARPGQSFHNYRVAFDVVPIVGGKADWETQSTWALIGQLGEEVGLEWAGRWRRLRELAHFQLPGQNLAQLRQEFLHGS